MRFKEFLSQPTTPTTPQVQPQTGPQGLNPDKQKSMQLAQQIKGELAKIGSNPNANPTQIKQQLAQAKKMQGELMKLYGKNMAADVDQMMGQMNAQ